jgi:hypothetical protein
MTSAGAMYMMAEYLENALHFERLANDEDDALKEQLLSQAAAYRELAETRARHLGLAKPPVVRLPLDQTRFS